MVTCVFKVSKGERDSSKLDIINLCKMIPYSLIHNHTHPITFTVFCFQEQVIGLGLAHGDSGRGAHRHRMAGGGIMHTHLVSTRMF